MSKFLWTKKQDSLGPGLRMAADMVYSTKQGKTILFGGNNDSNIVYGDTWQWDGESWTQVSDLGPAPRWYHKMAYDSKRNRVVLYGGIDKNGADFGDTWEWDGENWTQMANEGPPKIAQHAMCYDSVNNITLLFGGVQQSGTIESSTWGWDGSSWTQHKVTGPDARYNHDMVFNGISKNVVLSGGATNKLVGDTWIWNGVVWTKSTELGPGVLNYPKMAATNKNIILFGGSVYQADGAPEVLLGNTWKWEGNHWSEILDFGPPSRSRHCMAYDSVRDRVVLFGGMHPQTDSISSLGDTWEGFEQ